MLMHIPCAALFWCNMALWCPGFFFNVLYYVNSEYIVEKWIICYVAHHYARDNKKRSRLRDKWSRFVCPHQYWGRASVWKISIYESNLFLVAWTWIWRANLMPGWVLQKNLFFFPQQITLVVAPLVMNLLTSFPQFLQRASVGWQLYLY